MFKQPNTIKTLAGITALGIFATSLHADVKKELSYSADLSNGDKVAFTGDIADVTLVKTNSEEVRYDVKLTYKSNDNKKAERMFEKIEWTFDDDGPTIELKEKIEKANKLDIDVTIYLPDNHPIEVNTASGDIDTNDDFNADTKLNVVSGDIDVQNITGDLIISAVSGDASVGDVSGNVSVDTVSGDATISSVGGSLEGDCVSGDIEIGNVSSSINFDSVSGDIHVSLTSENQGPVDCDTVSGDVTVICTEKTGLKFTAETVSGDIGCDLPMSNVEMGKRSFSGCFGDGKIVCKIETISGDIQIKN